MSRIGKDPVKIVSGVTAEVCAGLFKASGPLGELKLPLLPQISVEIRGDEVFVSPLNDEKFTRMMWGTTRNLIYNLIEGVAKGFTAILEINGVGYRAAVQGDDLVLNLGFSHDIRFSIPQDVTIKCEKPTLISIHGKDKQLVGQVAAKIRAYRPPEPYKGKGIRYKDEFIVRKEGKKK